MKLMKKLTAFFAIIILFLFATLLFLITDNSEMVNNSLVSKGTIEAYRNEKLVEAVGDAIKNSGEMTIHVSEEDLNMLANFYMTDKLVVLKEQYHISNFEIKAKNSDLEFGIKMKCLGLVPTIIRIKFIPVIKDNDFALEISSVKIGRLSLTKKIIFELLSEAKSDKFQIDKNEKLIIINTDLPDQLIIQSIAVDKNNLTIGFKLEITSINDILELIS